MWGRIPEELLWLRTPIITGPRSGGGAVVVCDQQESWPIAGTWQLSQDVDQPSGMGSFGDGHRAAQFIQSLDQGLGDPSAFRGSGRMGGDRDFLQVLERSPRRKLMERGIDPLGCRCATRRGTRCDKQENQNPKTAHPRAGFWRTSFVEGIQDAQHRTPSRGEGQPLWGREHQQGRFGWKCVGA